MLDVGRIIVLFSAICSLSVAQVAFPAGVGSAYYSIEPTNHSDLFLLRLWGKKSDLARQLTLPLGTSGSAGVTTDSALDTFPIIDGHNDLPYHILTKGNNDLTNFDFSSNLGDHPVYKGLHTDLPRLRQGKVGAQFWVAYTDCDTQYKDAVAANLEQIDVIKRLVRKYPNDLELVTTADGILEAIKKQKIASLIAVEGGHAIDSRLSVLRTFYDLGVRYLTLTHVCNTPWSDSSVADDKIMLPQKGLTEFGKNVVLEMNRLGMMVDLAHVSKLVMDTAIDVSVAPVIFSHSNAYSVHKHNRNVHDDTLLKLKNKQGIIMVNFFTNFLGKGKVSRATVVDHINYIANLLGPDYVGIGSDFDGIPTTPEGLDDVSKYPDLFAALQSSNSTLWTRENLEKLAGRNLIRVMKRVEEVRDQLVNTESRNIWIPNEDLNKTEQNMWQCRTVPKPLSQIFKDINNSDSDANRTLPPKP